MVASLQREKPLASPTQAEPVARGDPAGLGPRASGPTDPAFLADCPSLSLCAAGRSPLCLPGLGDRAHQGPGLSRPERPHPEAVKRAVFSAVGPSLPWKPKGVGYPAFMVTYLSLGHRSV